MVTKAADLLTDESLATDKGEPKDKPSPKPEAKEQQPQGQPSPDTEPEEEEETSEEEGEEEEPAEEVEGAVEGVQAEAEAPAPITLTDEQKLQLLATDPALQQMVQREAERRIQTERQAAATKAEADRIKGLIDSEDFESLGKEYAESLKRGQVDHAAQQAASDRLFGQVIPAAFSDPASKAAINAMTKEEAWDIHPNNPVNNRLTDDQYAAKFIQRVVGKREALAEDRVRGKKAAAQVKADKNSADGVRLRGGAPDVPAGKAGTALQGSARDLLHSHFEEADNRRE